MLIAVSSSGQDLNSQIDPRFGRCQYFVFVDPDSMEFEAVENSNISAASGAGIQSAQMVADRGAEVVITGNCGPNAFQTLSAAGVQVITGVSGTVNDAVQALKSGQLQPISNANVSAHSGVSGGMQQPGMGAGIGRAGGMGRGGGMGGMGRGAGMGRGMGRGRFSGFGAGGQGPMAPMTNVQPGNMAQAQQQPNANEVQDLKEQITALQKQVQQLTDRLSQAEKDKQS